MPLIKVPVLVESVKPYHVVKWVATYQTINVKTTGSQNIVLAGMVRGLQQCTSINKITGGKYK